jgi:hypothetical protein
MKTLLIIGLLFSYQIAKSQIDTVKLPMKDSIVLYEKIINLPDTNTQATKIYTAVQVWFANTFKDSKYVLKVEDKEAGKLVGRGSILYIPFLYYGEQYLTYGLEIDIKKGKYRYKIYDLKYERGDDQVSVTDYQKAYLRDINKDTRKAKKLLVKWKDGLLFADKSCNALSDNLYTFVCSYISKQDF